jgi:hypothetical protein
MVVMNRALITRSVLASAVALVLPFALYEIFVVAKTGTIEPYTYTVSLPLSLISFALIQASVGYGIVVGWSASGMSKNIALLSLWFSSALFLWLFPCLFPSGGL